uniref:Ion transport domain-containing protein n=1 Tax=Anopheles albimanus TaxID=7167 RepID=A0A182FP20_ANOAL
MFSGELEASSLEFNDLNWIPFALFLFLVSIVINNLIIGHAISDITKIEADSEVVALAEKVFMINKHENALNTLKRHIR